MIRPRRQTRRGAKSDPADAEAAARAVLSGEASGLPKSADGAVEAIRMLRAARRSAVKARTCAINQLKALLVTAPEQVAAPLRGSRTAALMAACCGCGPAAARPSPPRRCRCAAWRVDTGRSALRSPSSTPRSPDCAPKQTRADSRARCRR